MQCDEILDLFWDANRLSVDAAGIRIPQAVAAIATGKFALMAMAMTGPTAALDTYAHIARLLVRERPQRVVFGLDRYSIAGQGVATRDLLSAQYWDGHAWHFGVIAYRHEPRLFEPIDWNNPHWTRALRDEMSACWRRIVPRPGREPSPAMELPLRVAGANDPHDYRGLVPPPQAARGDC